MRQSCWCLSSSERWVGDSSTTTQSGRKSQKNGMVIAWLSCAPPRSCNMARSSRLTIHGLSGIHQGYIYMAEKLGSTLTKVEINSRTKSNYIDGNWDKKAKWVSNPEINRMNIRDSNQTRPTRASGSPKILMMYVKEIPYKGQTDTERYNELNLALKPRANTNKNPYNSCIRW